MELEDDSAMSPELMKYLNRNYWEQKQASQSAAPVHSQVGSVTDLHARLSSVTSHVY